MAASKKQNVVFVLLIAILICVLIVVGILLAVNSSGQSKLAKKAESYQSQLEEQKAENDKLKEENNALQEENSSLKQENSSLVEELAKRKANTGEGVCYLTFDDGPSDNTLRNLDTLAKYNAKATFFVISSAKLEYLQKIADGGHAIGLHSGSHDYSKVYASVDAYFADLDDIAQKVKGATGIEPDIIRFPGGSSNTVSRKYCSGIMTTLSQEVENRGYHYFDWNVSSGDASGNGVSPDILVNNVLSGAQGQSSVCVLMHDTAAKGTTSEALPRILEGLKSMGFRFEALNKYSRGFHQGINN